MAISVNDIKKMPTKYKILAVVLVMLLILYFYWMYFLSSAMTKRSELNGKLTETEEKIKEKEKIAKDINKYTSEVKSLTEKYKTALLKLPDQREVPALFHSVSLAGKDAGVDFLLFEPKASVPKVVEKAPTKLEKTAAMLKPSDQKEEKTEGNAQKPDKAAGKKGAAPPPEPFYEEIPVAVTVSGTYQSILSFFEKVAKLPRIINVADISMGGRTEVKGRGQVLTASCTIKTYMFIDKKEKVSEKTK